ncbi:Serpin B4 [Fukomys damarensis]|uniref:Serpin B4 n=1 Tax=Fukomys damarensis TaxID=885580 RepID=A0A091DNV6_FUKDA|nr:Serpin B4 [Fukomys damarensis]
MSSLSEANIKFTLDLFQELRNATGNIFFSPTSITAQLAMVYLGAKGKTAQEIEKVLHFSEITEKSKEKTLTNQEYLDDLKNFYLTDVESVDFENETEESRKKINTWVEKQTHDKIKEIFPQGSLHSDAKLILVNAVYFKGDWIMKFEGKDTVERKFWLNKDTSKTVQMMEQSSHLKFAYLEDVQAKMLEMPYKGKALSMVVLLPNEVDGLQQLEDKLTVEKLMEWTSLQSMKKTDVNLHLPKFTMEESYNLESKLINMGMKKAFSPQDADLSSMSRDKDLVVSTVTHKAFVKVHEEGAEAAALEDKLTVEKLMEWTSLQSMKKTDVNLHLPKFTMEESYNLESKLINMGMKKAFSPQDADLSSMSRDKDLVVSTVTHKAFVKVHEEGAEAAAVSGRVASVTLATIHKDFHCDHPFIFFIKQNSNNNILFFGRVSSP